MLLLSESLESQELAFRLLAGIEGPDARNKFLTVQNNLKRRLLTGDAKAAALVASSCDATAGQFAAFLATLPLDHLDSGVVAALESPSVQHMKTVRRAQRDTQRKADREAFEAEDKARRFIANTSSSRRGDDVEDEVNKIERILLTHAAALSNEVLSEIVTLQDRRATWQMSDVGPGGSEVFVGGGEYTVSLESLRNTARRELERRRRRMPTPKQ